MDCGMTADAYTDAALQPSASFRMMVVVGGRTNLLDPDARQLQEPGAAGARDAS